jgi:hypothetical protein
MAYESFLAELRRFACASRLTAVELELLQRKLPDSLHEFPLLVRRQDVRLVTEPFGRCCLPDVLHHPS